MKTTKRFGNTIIENDDGSVTTISKEGDIMTLRRDGTLSSLTRHGYEVRMFPNKIILSGDPLGTVKIEASDIVNCATANGDGHPVQVLTLRNGGRVSIRSGDDGKAREIEMANGVKLNLSNDGAIALAAPV